MGKRSKKFTFVAGLRCQQFPQGSRLARRMFKTEGSEGGRTATGFDENPAKKFTQNPLNCLRPDPKVAEVVSVDLHFRYHSGQRPLRLQWILALSPLVPMLATIVVRHFAERAAR